LFEGTTISDTLAAVLKQEPDYNALPPSMRKLVRSCLAKDPHQRLRDIGDTRLLMTDEPPAPSAARTRSSVFCDARTKTESCPPSAESCFYVAAKARHHRRAVAEHNSR